MLSLSNVVAINIKLTMQIDYANNSGPLSGLVRFWLEVWSDLPLSGLVRFWLEAWSDLSLSGLVRSWLEAWSD